MSGTAETRHELSRLESTFPGNSEMAARCRAFDWAASPLGPVEGWSQTLRATIGIVLLSRNPMFIFWGPKLIQFYNDAYAPSLGEGNRRLAALGAEARNFWTDIWEIIGPEIDRVMTKGESTWNEDQLIPIERNGAPEDAWWTYGYSPVHDDDGTIGGVLVVCMETTQRVRDEQIRQRLLATLVSERTRLSSIFELAPAFLAIGRGPDHVFERINPAYLALVGNRELIGRPVAEAMPEMVDQGFIEILDGVRATGEPFFGKQAPILLARGEGGAMETRYVDFVYQRITDPDGEFVLIAHGIDVTEQVLSSQSLQRVELQLRDQFAKLPVPTILWEACGADFILVDFNEAARRSLQVFNDDAPGKLTLSLFPDSQAVTDLFHKCLREDAVAGYSATVPSATGTRTFDLTIGPQQPNRVLVHAVDTTQRAELEEQLRQSQKMEAVGRLAGGIAHDFNNILTVIEGHSAMLMEALEPDDPMFEDAEEINKAGVRAAGLTRQLLAFSNKQILKPVRLQLNELIRDTQKMLSRLLGETFDIVVDLRAGNDAITGDPSQMSQVLMNLALNARDAMDGRGVLTLTTSNVRGLGDELLTPGLPPGKYVLLEVSDTGAGMSEQTQAHMFEPFFTTKQQGKGTGLGLATVFSIVSTSGGHIIVESAPDRGTKFKVYLPMADTSVGTTGETPVRKISVKGDETILVVEDESAVRQVVIRLLKNEGYSVLAAEDGVAALALAGSFDGHIDLVISDTVMPGMGGAEVVDKLQKMRPALKALFMSGHTDNELLRSGIKAATVKFVQKPFSATELSAAVRDALLQP